MSAMQELKDTNPEMYRRVIWTVSFLLLWTCISIGAGIAVAVVLIRALSMYYGLSE